MPSQHVARSEGEQELTTTVHWLVAQRRMAMLWLGRIEALLGRPWPEVTRLLPLASATLLRALAQYGSPAILAANPAAAAQLRRWARQRMAAETAAAVVASAGATLGVRMGEMSGRVCRAMRCKRWRPGGRCGKASGGCVPWPRIRRCCKPRGVWWVCRRRVCCGVGVGDPRVPVESCGNVRELAAACLCWGREQGYL